MQCALKNNFYFSSLVSILLLSSCGGSKSGADPKVYTINAQMSLIEDLSVEERAIATRICYAYQSKSSNFRGQNYNSGTFIFNINSRNCLDIQTDYSVNSTIKSSPTSMSLVAKTTKPFVSVIQTDQSGYLTQLCSKIRNNQPISNTVSDESSNVQISFFRDTLDSYTIRYFRPVMDSNNLKIDSMEIFKVVTQASADSGQIQGMDAGYSLFQTCGTSDKYSEFTQIFSSFTK